VRLTAPKTWTRWFWAGAVIFIVYNAVAADRAHGYYYALWDECEPDRRFQGQPGIECAGGLRFYIGFVSLAWILGGAVAILPMLIAYMHAARRADNANLSSGL
jgi:hypothetical protein